MGEEIITNARKTAVINKYQILYDVTKANVDVSIPDWFFLPRTLPVLQDPKLRIIRAAVLIPHGNQERDYSFYENVTHNVGMDLKIFFEEEDALIWLKGE